jgi:glutamate/tyrosine decarboxylase-like PLP-dependent enzyme
MLACKAYRNRAYDNGIRYPEMIVPLTGHAAFDKAAFYFCIKLVHIRLDPVTFKADVKAMKKAINKNTCMVSSFYCIRALMCDSELSNRSSKSHYNIGWSPLRP